VATGNADANAVLTEGSGFAQAGGSEQVRLLQRRLQALGQAPGPIDGLFGPRTEAAVLRFQREQGIATDGVAGPQTANALRHAHLTLSRGAGFGQPGGSQQVRSLQRRLRALGQSPGAVDGLFGARTEAAVMRFQGEQGIAADGVVGPVTHRVADRQQQRPRVQERRARARTTRPRGKPSQARPTPVRRSERAARQQQVTHKSDSGLSGGELAVIVAACALGISLLGAAAIVIRRDRRRRRHPTVIPIYHDLIVEGRSADPRIDHFEGQALALSMVVESDHPDEAPETSYLVADPGQPEPFWVPQSDIVRFERVGAEPDAAPEPDRQPGEMRAIGYATSPSAEELRGGELERQAEAIERACARLGLVLVEVVRDVEAENGKGSERPGLAYALEQIAAGKASCLVVAELERLSHSVPDLGVVLDWFGQGDKRLVAADMGLDTGTPSGRLASKVLVSVSGWERERISARTRKGLEAARAKGAATGRPAVADRPALRERIAEMRGEGMTLQAIADALNEEGVPTLRGGTKWRPSSVQAAAGYKRRRKNDVSNLPPPNGRAAGGDAGAGEQASDAGGEQGRAEAGGSAGEQGRPEPGGGQGRAEAGGSAGRQGRPDAGGGQGRAEAGGSAGRQGRPDADGEEDGPPSEGRGPE
jgi:peptidoglycan hydrolase-like protein with peptidoglycan-binding domain/DNA invertase Pin-like site-specific DNA recombinase